MPSTRRLEKIQPLVCLLPASSWKELESPPARRPGLSKRCTPNIAKSQDCYGRIGPSFRQWLGFGGRSDFAGRPPRNCCRRAAFPSPQKNWVRIDAAIHDTATTCRKYLERTDWVVLCTTSSRVQ